jgi:hypothetical protein
VVARALSTAGREVAIDGYSRPYVAAIAYASAFYGVLALVLGVRIVEGLARTWPPLAGRGVVAALVIWIGTPLAFYMYIAPPMSHATSAFAVAAFLVAWIRVRDAWRPHGLSSAPDTGLRSGMALLGALAALMAMVREQDAFFAVAPAIDFLWSAVSARDGRLLQRMQAAVVGIVTGAIAYLPQAVSYVVLNGHVGPSRLVARKMTWTAPHVLGVLASAEHGLFIWTPVAALALVGLIVLAWHLPRDARPLGLGLLLAAALQVYVAGSVESWTVAGAFGQRRFVALTALLVVGIAALGAALRTPPWRARLLATALAVGVWWNISLMVQFGAGMMDRQRLEPARIAYNTFVVVPRALPGLAWRYLFDRGSFYESARQLRKQ